MLVAPVVVDVVFALWLPWRLVDGAVVVLRGDSVMVVVVVVVVVVVADGAVVRVIVVTGASTPPTTQSGWIGADTCSRGEGLRCSGGALVVEAAPDAAPNPTVNGPAVLQ